MDNLTPKHADEDDIQFCLEMGKVHACGNTIVAFGTLIRTVGELMDVLAQLPRDMELIGHVDEPLMVFRCVSVDPDFVGSEYAIVSSPQ